MIKGQKKCCFLKETGVRVSKERRRNSRKKGGIEEEREEDMKVRCKNREGDKTAAQD